MVSQSSLAEQAYQSVNQSIYQSIEQSVNQIISEDNNARKQGEATLQNLKQSNKQSINQLMICMALLLCDQAKSSNFKQFVAVMLRQYCCIPLKIARSADSNSPTNNDEEPNDMWRALPAETQSFLRQIVLERLIAETNQSTDQLNNALLHKLIDLIAMIASRSCNDESIAFLKEPKTKAKPNQWPELIPAIFNLSNSQSSNPAINQTRIEVMIRCIEKFIEMIDIAVLRPDLLSITQILEKGIQASNATPHQSTNQTIRKSSMTALVYLMLALDPRESQTIARSIEQMLRSLEISHTAIIQHSTDQSVDEDEELLLSGIQALVDLAHDQPTLLRSQLDRTMNFMSSIVQPANQSTNPFDDDTRKAAFEYLLALSSSGGMIRKHSKYASMVVPLCFKCMTEIEGIEPMPKQELNPEEDEFDEYDMHKMAREGIVRICHGLQGKVLPLIVQMFGQLIGSSEWVNRFAGVCGLADTCSELADKLASDGSLDRLLDCVLQLLANDSNVRVRCAAAEVISRIMEKAEEIPEFHAKFHAKVVPVLIAQINAISGQASTLVALLAAVGTAVKDFTEDMDGELLNGYAPALFNALMPLITTQSLAVQEAIVGVLSSLIHVLSEAFRAYYEAMWPSIEMILVQARAPEHRALLAKAIECAGVIAEAVGHETFAPKAAPLMELLVSIQRSENSTTTRDPMDELPNMLVICEARVARCLGSRFKPYLQYVIPPLLASASIVNEYALLDNNCPEHLRALVDTPGYETTTLNVNGAEGLRLTVNTSMFEEKATACNMLYQYAEDLKGDFVDYAVDTARVLIPLMQYKFHESVRIAACAACPALLVAVNEGWANQPEKRDEVVTQLLAAMFDAFLKVCESEPHLDQLTGHLEVFHQSIDALNQSPNQHIHLTTAQYEQVTKLVATLVTESVGRQEDRAKRRSSPDFDEEEEETIEDENKQEEEMLGFVYSLCASLIRVGNVEFLPFYDSTLHAVFSRLCSSSSPELVTLGICVEAQLVNDVDLPGPLKQSYCTHLWEVCARHALSDVVDLRQSACFGIGACARRLGMEFAPVVPTALPLLVQVIESPASRSEENAPATDNAVSSYIKILQNCADSPIIAQQSTALWGKFLGYLPCGGDDAEAKVVHDVLIQRCLSGDPAILGAHRENVRAVIYILANLLDSDYLSPAGQSGAQTLIKQWAQQLGAGFSEILQSLDQDDRESLQKALSS